MSDYIIGISGGSGSGKTTFLNHLKSHFENDSVSFISLDNYYQPREKQKIDDQGIRNFDLPESIISEDLVKDILTLRSGQSIERLEYVFNNAEAEPTKIITKPAKVYIVEGLFIYHYPELKKLFDLKLFIHAKDCIKLIRRIKRDKVERNYPLEDVIYRYEHHVLPSYESYIEKYKEDVDLIINNNQSFDQALELIKTFIKAKL